ncbi:hypothetical protein [Burkholderia gladioli]|uniref:Uncharacterized protein n=1 Tax=Burkholderia gladioli TaxID=28095 RepID=A0AB38U5T2_BURGA|nr:hypothetical protein [Burkholderia gladioli]UWX75332.1 hypothetical protein NYZ96_35205 [Burkholderia gladioli]
MTNNTTADLDRDIAHLIDSSENGIARVPRETLVRLRALLTSPRAAGLPEGWKLVPIEPTQKMLDCWWDGLQKGAAFVNCTPRGVYGAMLDAAPAAPVAEVKPLAEGEIAITHPVATAENSGTILYGLLHSFVEIAAGFPSAKIDPQLADQVRVYLPAQAVAANGAACQGKNCGATDGVSHSPECVAEHEAAVTGAVAADGEAADDLLQLDVLLANLHAAVWHAGAGDDGPVDYDMAGKDEAKAIQAHVRAMFNACAAVPLATVDERETFIEILRDEQQHIAADRDMCDPDDELPRWDALQRVIDHLKRAAVSPATANTTWTAPKQHCQNGGDVCLAGNRDGVCCPEDSCDIDDGTRKNPATADERAAFEAAYAVKWNAAYGNKTSHTAADVAALREGDSYGEDRTYLNAMWEGWQARTSQAAAPQANAADARAALRWTAGTLQEIVSGRWKGAKESDKVSIGAVTKTVAQVLDMADAALGVASQAAAPAEAREPVGWFDKSLNQIRWRDGLVNADFADRQPFYTYPVGATAEAREPHYIAKLDFGEGLVVVQECTLDDAPSIAIYGSLRQGTPGDSAKAEPSPTDPEIARRSVFLTFLDSAHRDRVADALVGAPADAGEAVAPSADLIARCIELRELSDHGESDQLALRALADTYRRDIHSVDRRAMAVSHTHREAVQYVLDAARAQGAQGGKGGEA